MEPIKILQVFTLLNRGGAETNLMNYYRNLDRTKFQFDFLVHRFEVGAYEEEIKELGGKIYRIPPIHPLFLSNYKKELKKFLKTHPEYRIIHDHTSELGFFLATEARRLKVPTIIGHAHSHPNMLDEKSIFRSIWKRILRKNITQPFTCGKESANWLFGKEIGKKAYLMNNAISVEKYKYIKENIKNIKRQLGVLGDRNFVHVGNFTHPKNHLFLLDVFSELIKIRTDSHLYLIGDGELRPEIEKIISKKKLDRNVHLLGVRDDVHELLQAMEYFVFPSLFEGLGIAFIEAQAAGLRCFISDGVPVEGILVKENVEVISLKKSAQEWAETILQNLEYERIDTSEIIRAAGYDIVENAKKLEEKYLQLLNKHSLKL